MAVNALREAAVETAADEFQALEEKIRRTVELLKAEREARVAAERDATRVRQQVRERQDEFDSMRAELVALRREREEVRSRVEKMLRQIDALTEQESAR
jgi:chromosome segregation ATPase